MIKRVALMISIFIAGPASAQTAVGSGGDVLKSYVQEIAYKIVEALDHLGVNPDNQPTLCRNHGLNLEQQIYCRDLLLNSTEEFRKLVRFNPVEHEITDERLYRRRPDRILVEVAAITMAGSSGNIRYNYDKVAGLNPVTMMALVTHEFGHKIAWSHVSKGEPRDHILDYGPVGPFAQGHVLLDHLGIALAQYALQHSLIATTFRYTDKFYCEKFMVIGEREVRIGSEYLYAPRRFTGTGSPAEKLKQYEFGIGPGQGVTALIPEGDNCLSFTLHTIENNNCSESGERSTLTQVWRHFPADRNNQIPEPQLLQEERFAGLNPSCQEDEVTFTMIQDASDTTVKVQCTYVGGEALPTLQAEDQMFSGTNACRHVKP